METLQGFRRSGYCGDWRMEQVGQEVSVCGWVQRQRDLGGLIFVDLRDRTGLLQLAFDDATAKDVFEKASSLRAEFVVAARGLLREREAKTDKIPTGDVELYVSELRLLARSETPPFEITEDCNANETLRLKHRYLDLRRPNLQRNLLFRHKVAKITRDYFDEHGFVEIETPVLVKSTPEGARDYLVPSRIHPGTFYALPQSPQIYKQLTMVAGFDRYLQIARCFRDEDLRADRQPEFTQIDLEMSFVDIEDVLVIGEGYMKRLFADALGIDLPAIPRLTYREAMERYGTDKPDTRYGLALVDLTETLRGCGFGVFSGAIEAGGSVRAINVKDMVQTISRKEVDKLTEYLRGIGGKGLAWIRMTAEGPSSSFTKFLTEAELSALLAATGAEMGDVVLLVADGNNRAVLSQLGSLRVEVAKRYGLIPEGKFNLLWILEFPFFDWDEEHGRWVAMHHPFTSPMEECFPYLESDKGAVRAKAYDLVLNGIELASGSIRITDPALQNRVFSMLGLSSEEAERKFGFLTGAFRYGAPPHGGMALGLDRIVMQLLGAESLRDVVAFPKVQNASELMTQCPDVVDRAQLQELGIALTVAPPEEQLPRE